MTKDKHTPGPWTLIDEWTTEIVDADERHIAYVNCNENEGQQRPDEEATANATLITAAPDILQGLRRAVECLDVVIDDLQAAGLSKAAQSVIDDRNSFRILIAKATNTI